MAAHSQVHPPQVAKWLPQFHTSDPDMTTSNKRRGSVVLGHLMNIYPPTLKIITGKENRIAVED